MAKTITLIFFILLAIDSYAQSDSINNTAIYTVKTEISELKNRTLECKVRDHTIIVDQPKAFGADDLGANPSGNVVHSLWKLSRFNDATFSITTKFFHKGYICGS